MASRHTSLGPLADLALALTLALLPSGCVTKSEARLQAQRAYLAGQHVGEQAAMQRMQPAATGQTVNFVGQVDRTVVPWFDGLTLARAIINAGYYGAATPRLILIHRGNNQVLTIDPKLLIDGDDLPVQAGDVIELQQQ